MNEPTIVILTAMNLEYNAVRARLSDVTAQTHPMGTRFEVGYLGNACRAVLALTGKGNQSAAVLAERAVAEFGPCRDHLRWASRARYSRTSALVTSWSRLTSTPTTARPARMTDFTAMAAHLGTLAPCATDRRAPGAHR